jgi:circadian clock protein KaiC
MPPTLSYLTLESKKRSIRMEKSEVTNTVKIEASSKTNERRVSTGIEGFDDFVEGGFPRGSMILLAGSAGSGKTIFASQYLYHGMSKFNESGVYVSLAENRSTFMKCMKKIGMDFEKYEQKGKFKFLDMVTVRDVGVESLVERVLAEVDSLGASRLVIDSFSAIAQAFSEKIDVRIFLHSVLGKMTNLTGTTTLLISERPQGTECSQGGIEEFVTDGVIALNSVTRKGWLIRTLQVLKLRGTKINSEEHCYGIDIRGIRTYPLPDIPSVRRIYSEKVPTGIEGLDKMLSGGVFKGSTTLIGGASGAGKTTFALHFITEAAKRGVRGLYISFEEPEQQLVRHAEGHGWNMNEFVDRDLIKFLTYCPEPFSVEQQLDEVFGYLRKYRPARLVIDTIVALERVLEEDRYLRYLKSLTLYLKDQGITSLFTALAASIVPIIGTGISANVDNIIGLRQVEIESSLRRSVVILKTRGSTHDNRIREFEITPKGVELKEKFLGMEQILGGTPKRSIQEKPSGDGSRPSRVR